MGNAVSDNWVSNVKRHSQPVIYSNNNQDIVLAINTYVTNDNCAGVTYHTKIDTTQVLNWINQYFA